ncbi:MAG: hypothetical protein H8D88_00060 [Bacteroidetes bacterium]|nr:hypothetical protein [Bacteroidota bacterium]
MIQLWIFILFIFCYQLLWDKYEVDLNTIPLFLKISDFIGNLLLVTTPAVLNLLFNIEIVRSGFSIILPNEFSINYFFYLSGIKQMCLVILLFILIPGPWKQKLWYVPITVIGIFITVFVQFLVLTFHCLVHPEHLHLIQDLLVGPIFYFVILVMWMVWVLVIAKTASLKNDTVL